MEDLLKPGVPVDLELLNEAVSSLYDEQDHGNINTVNEILIKFIDREDSHEYAGAILESKYRSETKYIALLSLHKAVKFRWMCFEDGEKEETRNLVVNYIEKYVSDNWPSSHIAKLNNILVEILKYEMPDQWDFIPQLLESAGASLPMWKNAFQILSLIVDEIDASLEWSLTSVRAAEMQVYLGNFIDDIIGLIEAALQTEDESLIKAGLTTLGRLVNNFQLSQICTSNILQELCQEQLGNPDLTVSVIGVLASVLSLNDLPEELYPLISELFGLIVDTLSKIVGDNFCKICEKSGDEAFLEYFVSAITSFLIKYPSLIETEEHSERLSLMLGWIAQLTSERTTSESLFEELLEYWHSVLERIYQAVMGPGPENAPPPQYAEHFPLLTRTLIERMPPPLTSTNYIDGSGIEHRRVTGEVLDSTYTLARELFVFLANFDSEDTLSAVTEKIEELQQNILAPSDIKSLCWAVGALPGAVGDSEDELISVLLKTLLETDGDYGERIASMCGFAFAAAQFSSFLKRNPGTAEEAVRCVLGFMGESCVELQETCVSCLRRLAKSGVLSHPGIVDYMYEGCGTLIEPLDPEVVPRFFEVLSCLIQLSGGRRAALATGLAEFLIERFNTTIDSAEGWGVAELDEVAVILMCLTRVTVTQRAFAARALEDFLPCAVERHILFSLVMRMHPRAPGSREYSALQHLRANLCAVITAICGDCTPESFISGTALPLAMGPILDDFEECAPLEKVPQVLDIFANLICNAPALIAGHAEEVLKRLYAPVAELVMEDFDSVPAIRDNFYGFVARICKEAPTFIAFIPERDQAGLVECLKWGCRHPDSEIARIAVGATGELFASLALSGAAGAHFCERFAVDVFVFAFQILADMSLKQGFTAQVQLIARLARLPLVKTAAAQVGEAMCAAFPTQSPPEIEEMLAAVLSDPPENELRTLMKNFICTVRQISPRDPDLNETEREQMKRNLREMFCELPGFIEQGDDGQIASLTEHLSQLSIRV